MTATLETAVVSLKKKREHLEAREARREAREAAKEAATLRRIMKRIVKGFRKELGISSRTAVKEAYHGVLSSQNDFYGRLQYTMESFLEVDGVVFKVRSNTTYSNLCRYFREVNVIWVVSNGIEITDDRSLKAAIEQAHKS